MINKKVTYSPALASPPDSRDYPASFAMDMSNIKLPKDFSVWQPPVEDQGQISNCVAQSLANVMECIEYLRTNEHKEYSVGYIYGRSSNPMGKGMVIREACDILRKEGDVYRAIWECLEENPDCFDKRFFVSDYIKSQAKKIDAYVKLETKEEVKAFIYKYNIPVVIAAKTSAYEGGSSDGLHATVCYGWESEETFRNREGWKGPNHIYKEMLYTNSWGTYWADPDGRGNISFEDLTEVWGVLPMEIIKLKDIEGRWSEKDVNYCVENGVIKGYEDNTFKPRNEITREETAVIAARILRNIDAKIEQHNKRLKVLEDMLNITTGN